MASHIANISQATTVQGQPVIIDASDGVKINCAKVLTADIEASCGVIHVVDSALLPFAAAAAQERASKRGELRRGVEKRRRGLHLTGL